MSDNIEVALESALLNGLLAFAADQSIAQELINLPNVDFTPPDPGPQSYYLQGTFLPAPTAGLGIGFDSSNQYYGIFQVSVFYGEGAGELAPGRIASKVIAWFKNGSQFTKDGFTAKILRPPFRGPMIKSEPWMMLPVSIPYTSFAPS